MAFANFSITTVYATLISMLNTQLTAVAKLFKDQTTGDFVDQVRYNSSTKKLETWDGDSWEPLNLTGVAAGSALDSAKLGGSLPAEFATSTQGTKADNALPASSYTAADVMAKVNSIGAVNSASNADTLDGNHAAAFATSGHTHSAYQIASYATTATTPLPGANAGGTVAHGLGATPKAAILVLTCLTADNGYSVGDRLHNPHAWNGSGQAPLATWFDATNCGFFVQTGLNICCAHKTTGYTVTLTLASWSYKFLIIP